MTQREGSRTRTIDRRVFLKAAGVAAGATVASGIPGIVAAQKPSSFPKGTKLNILEWVSFVPASDVEFKRLAAEFGKLAGVDVTVDLINMNDLNPRIASAIETKAGPDIIMMISNWPHLYADGLADVDDLAEEIATRDGAFYGHNRAVSVVGKRWKALPLCSVPSTWAYREDWFKEAGSGKFPDTWDEWRKLGMALKKKGQPMGQAFGHSLGDPNNWAYSVTWGFGGAEIDESGKVAINSKETLEAVKFTVSVWKDCLDEGGLAWDDSSNNRAYLAGTISGTINGASIYFVAKRQFPDIAKVTTTATCPRGRGALLRHRRAGPRGHEVLQEPAGGEGVPPLVHGPAAVRQVDERERRLHRRAHPVLGEARPVGEGPEARSLQGVGQVRAVPGYPGPPNRKASEALVKYILVDMYAQAIKGMKAEDAVKWAESELKKAYA